MSLIINTATNLQDVKNKFDVVVLFIDRNTVKNSVYWENEAFRRINAKYSFEKLLFRGAKDLLRNSSAISVLTYSMYGETVRCLLLNGLQRQHKRAAVMSGLRTIQDRLTGYRCLAVQQAPVVYDFDVNLRRNNGGLCGDRRMKELLPRCKSVKRSRRPREPSIKLTRRNVWEMDADVDVVLFVDTGTMYARDWRDEVMERVNARYPFKHRFSIDADVVPAAPGNVRMYAQPDAAAAVFCVFFDYGSPVRFSDWTEDGLAIIKKSLAGRVSLAVQLDPSASEYRAKVHGNLRDVVRSAFAYDDVTVWLCCGDYDE